MNETIERSIRAGFRELRRTSPSDTSSVAEEMAEVMWVGIVADLELTQTFEDVWTTSCRGELLQHLGDDAVKVIYRASNPSSERWILLRGETICSVHTTCRGYTRITIAARKRDDATLAMDWFRERLPRPKPSDDRRVPIHFWSYRFRSAEKTTESMEVCSWEDVARNYVPSTRSTLEPYVRSIESGTGKLALWLGPPGTGKTYALRALAWEQRASISIHYILDPEMFLERVDYQTAVFREKEVSPDAHDERTRERAAEAAKARLVVLEDSGELLGVDARSRTGQGLSRLLNLTDGLPGQGTRTRVLITSNDDLGKLHPAVSRAGRCGCLVRFKAFEPADARAWLHAHGHADAKIDGPRVVAEMYASLRGEPLVNGTNKVGFAELRA